MSRYSKTYVNRITGKETTLVPEFYTKLPSRTHDGKEYPYGGWVLKGDEDVNKPAAAKPRKFTDKDAETIRKKVLDGNLKGFTTTQMKKFVEHEKVEVKDEPKNLRGWIKVVAEHVKEPKKTTTKKTDK